MISELRITSRKTSCIPWWTQVAWLKRKQAVKFKPGLNILVGPNGSGKSTILKACARMLMCEQGGRQAVTWSALQEVVVPYHRRRNTQDGGSGPILNGVVPVHDGSPTLYFNPDDSVGLVNGAFDDDFFMDGVSAIMNRGSSGETTAMKLGTIAQALFKNEWPSVIWKHQPREDETKEWFEKFLQGTLEKSCPTIILDEPTRSLDLDYEAGLWKKLVEISQAGRVQIIAAAHTPLVFGIPGNIHFIETRKGYVAEVRESLKFFWGELNG